MPSCDASVFVAGHRGMVGAAIVRRLRAEGFNHIITRAHAELDLADQAAVNAFFAEHRPRLIYLAAAKVGGILANDAVPADFIYQNLMIEANVISAAHRFGADRLLFLGSSCIYPRLADQPIAEQALLTGQLEATNEPYAIAKIAGIKLCESFNRQFDTDFRSVMPTNLYGPRDNFDLYSSHVVPALIRKFHTARINNAPEVEVWGSGRPRREFLHVDDLADACLFVMQMSRDVYRDRTEPMLSHINIGSGTDLTIRELAQAIKEITGFEGRLRFDESKPDGTPQKLLDVSRMSALGWKAGIGLQDGLAATYAWYVNHSASMKH